jgi:hypothetical protein
MVHLGPLSVQQTDDNLIIRDCCIEIVASDVCFTSVQVWQPPEWSKPNCFIQVCHGLIKITKFCIDQPSAIVDIHISRIEFKCFRAIFQGTLALLIVVSSYCAGEVDLSLVQTQSDSFGTILDAANMILSLTVDEASDRVAKG